MSLSVVSVFNVHLAAGRSLWHPWRECTFSQTHSGSKQPRPRVGKRFHLLCLASVDRPRAYVKTNSKAAQGIAADGAVIS